MEKDENIKEDITEIVENGEFDPRAPPERQLSKQSRASSASSCFQQMLDEVHASMDSLDPNASSEDDYFFGWGHGHRKISPAAIPVSGAGVAFLQNDHENVTTPTKETPHSTSYGSWKSQEDKRDTPKYKPAQRAQSVKHTTFNMSSENSSDRLSSYHENLLASKHLHTNQLISLHNLKSKLSKYQSYVERAFTLVNIDTEDAIIEGFGILAKVMTKSWATPKIGHDLAYGLCDYLRETSSLDKVIQCFVHTDTPENVRLAAGRALEECCSARNRDYMVKNGFLKDIIQTAKDFATSSTSTLAEALRISISLMESFFKHSPETSAFLIDLSTLTHVIMAIKSSKCSQVLRHCALAMSNLTMYSDSDCHQKMVEKKVQDWLFLLASHQDDITRYYACLAICMLVSNKEIEAAVIKSGTLSLVEPFLLAHKAEEFAMADYKHSQGRPQAWLLKLVPMLSASRCEARSLAAFHFAMEAGIKKQQEKLHVFQEIGAIEALKVVAARPDEVGPKFARMALKIIGEEVPYKLSQQVPLWSIEDVSYWVKNIGFEQYAEKFAEQMVDGDLLLLLTDSELQKDIGMDSGLLRKRFMRELASLKVCISSDSFFGNHARVIAADYSCVDESHMDQFLMSLNPYYSVYTYQMIELGIETGSLPGISEETLKDQCGVTNPIHCSKLLQAFQAALCTYEEGQPQTWEGNLPTDFTATTHITTTKVW